MIKIIPVFKVRILYKSGNSHEFWCKEFKIMGSRCEWKDFDPRNNCLLMGWENVEAVYQVGCKKKLFWK